MTNEAVKEVEPFTFEEVEKATGQKFDTVPYCGGHQVIGSLSSLDMLEWLEQNEDKGTRKEAGLNLLVKSVVDGKTRKHLPEDTESREKWKAIFRRKDNKENGILIKRILLLNGLDAAARRAEELAKNESSEAQSGASPTDSPSQPAS